MHMYDIDVRNCCKEYLDNHTAIVNALRSAAITYVFISWTPLLFCHLVPILNSFDSLRDCQYWFTSR